MIKRHIEKAIENTIKHFPVTSLTGPRQIGKSTILYNIFREKGFSYVSLDDSLELMMAKNDPRSFLEVHPSPLIIDEAQKSPELFLEIEKIVNQSRLEKGNIASNGMYILSGSQRRKLLDESKESLSGRVGILDMTNLSLNEILGFDNSPFEVDLKECSLKAKRYHLDINDTFKYIVRGFYPACYDDKDIDVRLFFSSYLTTYIEKDLKEEIKVNDEMTFVNFMRLLASNTGEELVYDNYAKSLGISTNTVKAWISALLNTGIISLLQPYNEESIAKRAVKRPKMYFFDTGLAAYLCGIDSPETLERSFLKGRFFETFIYNEIRKTFINEGIKQEFFYYRDSDQNEVDLLLLRDGKISCIEIKAGQGFNSTVTKSFNKLQSSKLEKGKNAIICNASTISILSDGTLILPYPSI